MHEDKMLKHKRDFDAKRRAEALDRKRRANLAAMRAVGTGRSLTGLMLEGLR